MTTRRLFPAAAVALAVALAAPPAAASADGHHRLGSSTPIEVVASFDVESGQTPEGLVIDQQGVIYTGFALSGEIRRIHPDGSQDIVTIIDTGGGLLLGLALDRHTGDLLAAVRAGADPSINGVWRVTPTGEASLWAATDPAGQPNGIFMDRDGTTYVGDSLLGVVWRINPASEVILWAAHPLLEGDPDAGVPIAFGANGVLVHEDSLFVANTDRASIVRIPIEQDGSAGDPSVFVSHPELLGADDMAFDVRGNLYVTTNGLGSSLVRVTPRTVETIATMEDGIDFPAQVKFGRGQRDARTLYVANVGLITGNAAVLAIQTPFAGARS
jgi:sugar lactone lactonase YvrE